MATGAKHCGHTRHLADLRATDIATAGGKGASLGAMLRSGLPVPEGFVVVTRAYEMFVQHNGLTKPVRALVENGFGYDPDTLTAAVQELKQAFLAGEIPGDVQSEITRAYEKLGDGLVVVRSSATTEDLPGASFAGQHDSFLNIEGIDAVCDAVRHCWASLWNPRAVSYRKHAGLDTADVAIAVVVQRMIDAQKAGVLFTANPIDHRRDRMLLSASFGLGEAVVAGEVTPDQWVLDTAGRIVSHRISDKKTITVREGKGTINRPMPEGQRRALTLDDHQVKALADLGQRAQAYFDHPQDIEWAMDAHAIHLVQSRPITSLFPLPRPLPAPEDGLRLYLCFNVHAQQMVEPITPMGIEYWRVLLAGFAHAATGRPERELPWLKVAAGRIFADLTELLRKPGRWPKLAESASEKDPITGQALLAFRDREGHRIIGQKGGFGLWWRLGLLAVRLGWRGLLASLSPGHARVQMLAEADAAVRRIEAGARRLKTMDERIRFLRDVLGRRGAIIWIIPVAVMAPGLMAEEALLRKVRTWLGDENLFTPVQRALPYNITTEMGLSLWRLARQLKAQGVEPKADHPEIARFLNRFGHRAVWEIDPGVPRWSEDPDYVLNLLTGYVQSSDDVDQEEEFNRRRAEARAASADLIARVRETKGRLQARIFAWQLSCYRALAGLREQPKFEGTRMIAIARQVFMAAGKELVEWGILDAADDVFFLNLEDLKAAGEGRAGDLRAKAAEARDEHEREMNRRAVPRWMTSDGEAIFGVQAEEAPGVLAGIAVSAGTHEGRVRVVLNPSASGLEAGEVMVCRGTDPAWTPLFLKAGALVMETGGAVSHGSIVAREYGLPAVAGVQDATDRLKNGQRVRVDGQSGQVVVLDDES
ncbi:MAG: hypothetical protein JJU36_15355 [Phycisphaeraceae bacterium]|nr:hypothetical protein [Phycisphaeraceae bacterium]